MCWHLPHTTWLAGGGARETAASTVHMRCRNASTMYLLIPYHIRYTVLFILRYHILHILLYINYYIHRWWCRCPTRAGGATSWACTCGACRWRRTWGARRRVSGWLGSRPASQVRGSTPSGRKGFCWSAVHNHIAWSDAVPAYMVSSCRERWGSTMFPHHRRRAGRRCQQQHTRVPARVSPTGAELDKHTAHTSIHTCCHTVPICFVPRTAGAELAHVVTHSCEHNHVPLCLLYAHKHHITCKFTLFHDRR